VFGTKHCTAEVGPGAKRKLVTSEGAAVWANESYRCVNHPSIDLKLPARWSSGSPFAGIWGVCEWGGWGGGRRGRVRMGRAKHVRRT
jgi:hypothetical protein